MLDEGAQHVQKGNFRIDSETRDHHGKWLRSYGTTYLQHERVFVRTHRFVDAGTPIVQRILLPFVPRKLRRVDLR